jgi:anaerobic ribonucleoside-triphosphate reductase activating protein
MLYTGYSLHAAATRLPRLTELVDILVPGRFVQESGPGVRWAGSANQEVKAMTPLGREQLRNAGPSAEPELQVALGDGGEVFMIGVPRHGDLERLESELSDRGVELRDVSWRP